MILDKIKFLFVHLKESDVQSDSGSAIIVKLFGGLGNQLFQYAFARHLAILNNAPLFLDITGFETYKLRRYSLHHFALKAHIAPKWEVAKALGTSNGLSKFAIWRMPSKGMPQNKIFQQIIEDDGFGFNGKLLQLKGCLYINGYWQTPLYFDDVKNIIRNDLKVTTAPTQANREMARRILDSNSVSVHVRRGDYVNNPKTRSIHGVCPVEYYQKAAQMISDEESRPKFFIFSDDIFWARKNLNFGGETVFVDINSVDQSYEDLRLMSLCRHHITANSTFSWWGAWLGTQGGITIAPARWMNNASKGPSSDDLLPSQWLKVLTEETSGE